MKDFSKYDDKQLIGFISLEGRYKEFAFNEIYFRYAKKFFNYCRLKCKEANEAKDMHQEIWLIFYQAILNDKSEIELPHYLYGAARKIYLQRCKIQNKESVLHEDTCEIDAIISPHINIEASIEEMDLINLVKAATHNLNDPLKETFYLKWFSGLTNNEIAELTGETIENVKQRGHRSMAKVVKKLSPFIKDYQIK